MATDISTSNGELFWTRGVVWFSEGENVAMMTGAAYYLHATLYRLRRNPVLTAMMVSSLVFGITVLIAGIAVWRVSSPCSIPQMSALPTVVQAVTEIASRSDLSIPHQALQAAQGMGIRQTPQGGSAFSHKDASASCPCAAPIKWQWQRI